MPPPGPEPAMDARFPATLRLKTPAEFKAVYDRKRSAADDRLIVYAGHNALGHPRVGLSVSRKVGGAVVRNRFKRLFREAFRRHRADLPPVDLVMIPRPHAGEPTLDGVADSLVRLAWVAARKLGPPRPPTSPRGRP